jgi:hypothetical protein
MLGALGACGGGASGPDASDGGPAPGADGGPVTAEAWPAASPITTADEPDAFGSDLSGLVYQPVSGTVAARLWAVRNAPSTLFLLEQKAGLWTPVSSDNWEAGKSLRYPSGSGSPDAEGLAKAVFSSSRMYVVAERDNDEPDVSRQSVLLFDTSGSAKNLSAAREWDLTRDLPAAQANLGLEAIAFIPDDFLTARGFVDESTGEKYDPSAQPEHGGGVVVVGAEATGVLYAYVLDHTSSAFERVARFESGNEGAMDLWLDRETGALWSLCDDGCSGRSAALTIGSDGRFGLRALYERPRELPNLNHEGLTMEPESACTDGIKHVLWADDSNDDGHAIRAGEIPCGAFFQ